MPFPVCCGMLYTKPSLHVILKPSNRIGVKQDVDFICKISRQLYSVVDEEILTEDVVITEQQILHIEEGHPGDYDRLLQYLPQVLQEPDYILRGNRPHTALVLKEILTPELTAEIIMR